MKLEELVGKPITEAQFDEAAGKKDACYHKVKARYDVWPSAYASGALVKCRKVGAANWGNKSKKEGLADRFKKNIDKYNKKAKKSRDYLKKLKKKKGVNEAGVEDRMLTIMKRMTKKYKTVKGLYTSKQKGGQMYFGFEDKAEAKDLEKELKKHLNKVKYQYEKSNDRHVVLALLPGLVDHVDKKQDVFMESITKDGMTETHIYWESDGKHHGYTFNFVNELNEAEYQGRKVKLGKIMQGDTKKFKVYVKNPKGNVVKVNFGQGGSSASKTGGTMRIRKSNPKARANFRARHNCDNPGPRHKARYWSCRKW